ncbi:MAG: hypothetical protein WAW17_33620 [Rhodococcus sp. (in: high G+C Gram-positive bacteria)]|uniref:hypothetical protein n=1 Tax=Rhodococcus sp. TaxID=1831 RepID=UPI003BAFF688
MNETRHSRRPRSVEVAYWIWILGAGLLILFGLIALTTSGQGIRDQLADSSVGGSADADTFVILLRVIGGVSVVFGLAIGVLSGAVRAGDSRIRFVIVVLSGVFAVTQILLTVVGIGTVLALFVPILLLMASVLVYRDSARGWFARA